MSVCESNRSIDDLYSLRDINNLLDLTFNRSVKVGDYFSDIDKFIKSVGMIKRLGGFDQLDENKRFRLKKHITSLRKFKGGRTSPRVKK